MKSAHTHLTRILFVPALLRRDFMKRFTESALSLKLKLPLSIVVIIVITFTISTIFTLFHFTSVVQSVKDSRLQGVAQNIGENISTQFHQAGRDMVMVASFPGVLQAIEFTPASEAVLRHDSVRAGLGAFYERLLLAYGYYDAFYLVNAQGKFIVGTAPAALELQDGIGSVPFREAMQKSGYTVGATLYSEKIQRTVVPLFLQVVYNGYTGALVSTLNIEKIANLALQTVPHEGMMPSVISLQNNTILNIMHDADTSLIDASWIDELRKQPSGVLRIPFEGEEYPVGFFNVPQTDIYILVSAQSSFMSEAGTSLRQTTLVTNIIAVIIVMAFLFFLTIPLTRDISKLSDFAKAVTEGKEDASICMCRKDELGRLAVSLETMVVKLKDMVVRSEEATKAKGDFLACMSHEIRTPMNGILGMTHLALKADPNETQRDFLLRINTAAQTLLGVINDILDFSKIEANKLDINIVAFRISAILASIRDMLQEKCDSKGLALILHVDNDVPDVIFSDPLRFSQICINLCSNAIKFTSIGEVRLHISLVEKRDKHLVLHVAVHDTGIGIAPEHQEKIFDSFSQADASTTRKYGGTGLGLSISKSLVELLGGHIHVKSVLNEGSTFSFTLRAEEGMLTDVEDSSPAQNIQHALPQLHILLAEDNEINQEIAIEILKDMGAEVSIANNGVEAVTLFEKGNFDLILMDIQMPQMDGVSAAQNIRQSSHPRAQDIPIIAMTAHAMSGDKAKSLEAGMNDHITKPIDIEELHKTLLTWGTKHEPCKGKNNEKV